MADQCGKRYKLIVNDGYLVCRLPKSHAGNRHQDRHPDDYWIEPASAARSGDGETNHD